jgi:hypothetical protein
MIIELEDLIDEFPGAANQTRCFTHILNLVAKSIIKQFDVPKAKAGQALDDAAQALAALAVDIDQEELVSRLTGADRIDGQADEDVQDDNVEGWTDIRNELSEAERDELDESVQPIRLVLVKVGFRLCNWLLTHTFDSFTAPQSCICNQELVHHYPASMV